MLRLGPDACAPGEAVTAVGLELVADEKLHRRDQDIPTWVYTLRPPRPIAHTSRSHQLTEALGRIDDAYPDLLSQKGPLRGGEIFEIVRHHYLVRAMPSYSYKCSVRLVGNAAVDAGGDRLRWPLRQNANTPRGCKLLNQVVARAPESDMRNVLRADEASVSRLYNIEAVIHA